MNRKLVFYIVTVCIAGPLMLGLALAMDQWDDFFALDAASRASWVQAIGTIAAIIAAAGVSLSLEIRRAAAAKSEDLDLRKAVATTCRDLAGYFDDLIVKAANRNMKDFEFEGHKEPFEISLATLDAYLAYKPTVSILRHVVAAREMLARFLVEFDRLPIAERVFADSIFVSGALKNLCENNAIFFRDVADELHG